MTVNPTFLDLDPNGLMGPLGAHHFARLSEQGPDLMVHFANAPKGMDAHLHHSALEVQARKRGWSLLTVVAKNGHDFRAPEVVAFFDGCADAGLFDQFDRTLFYGDDEGGYAALCYALAAPDACIVSVTPKPPLTQGEERYAPSVENLSVASELIWLHDPTREENVSPIIDNDVLTTRYLAPDSEARLLRYGVFWDLLDGVMAGTLDKVAFHAGLRARRNDRRYIRRLTALCLENGQFARAAAVTGSYAKRTQNPRFVNAYSRILSTHGLQGFASPAEFET